MRFDIWTKQREAATVLPNGLKVHKSETNGRFDLEMWMPKATNPFANYTFKTSDAREAFIAKAVANYDDSQARKVQYRKARSEGDASLADPGAIFCSSGGYDQTNVDYYQVIERHGLMVTVAEIGQETIEGSEGFMCETVRPAYNGFLFRCAAIVPGWNDKPTKCGQSEHCYLHCEGAANARGETAHAFKPERILYKKRLQFSDGQPYLGDCKWGSAHLVAVRRFGNMEPLVVETHYQSHYA